MSDPADLNANRRFRIVLVGADGIAARLLTGPLAAFGIAVTGATSLDAARALDAETGFDGLIIDRTGEKPESLDAGVAALTEARIDGFDLPAAFLVRDDDLVDGPEEIPGADATIICPIRPAELSDRLHQVLEAAERAINGAEALTMLGRYCFQPGLKRLSLDSATLRLTEKEVGILQRLADARPEAVAREKLLEDVWGYGEGITTHTVETHIYRLRRKIEAAFGSGEPKSGEAEEATLLVTDAGGYRLAAN